MHYGAEVTESSTNKQHHLSFLQKQKIDLKTYTPPLGTVYPDVGEIPPAPQALSWSSRLGRLLCFIVNMTVMTLLYAAVLYCLPSVFQTLGSFSQIVHTLVFDGASLLYKLTSEEKTMILGLHSRGELGNEVRNSLKTEIENLRNKISENAASYLTCDGERNQCKSASQQTSCRICVDPM